jgi:uncharacterized protein YndB with AHSA1/START domain
MGKVSANAEMLIRKPPADVFDAFSDPRTLEKFWLKSASAPLAENAIVEWEFLVEGARETVTVTRFMPGQIMEFEWSDGVSVRIGFNPHGQGATRVSITATGFSGSSQAATATEGFTIVLCDLKSLLETGQSGHMVRDKAALISADMADG